MAYVEAISPSYEVLKSRPSFCQDVELMAFCEGPIGFGMGCLLGTNLAMLHFASTTKLSC
jgi:hypothetical protein